MMALRLSPSEHSLTRYFDPPQDRPRLTNKTLVAAVAVAGVYSVLGVYFAGQRVAMIIDEHVEKEPVVFTTITRPEPPPVITETPPTPPPPTAPVRDTLTPPLEAVETLVAIPSESEILTPPTAIPIVRTETPPEPGGTQVATTTPAPVREGPLMISNPDWLSRPTSAQLTRAYPDRAIRLGVSGRATLRCAVMASGAVTGCRVLSETPAAYGFGEAALSLERYFRMSPLMVDGEAVSGAQVDIPVGFRGSF